MKDINHIGILDHAQMITNQNSSLCTFMSNASCAILSKPASNALSAAFKS